MNLLAFIYISVSVYSTVILNAVGFIYLDKIKDDRIESRINKYCLLFKKCSDTSLWLGQNDSSNEEKRNIFGDDFEKIFETTEIPYIDKNNEDITSIIYQKIQEMRRQKDNFRKKKNELRRKKEELKNTKDDVINNAFGEIFEFTPKIDVIYEKNKQNKNQIDCDNMNKVSTATEKIIKNILVPCTLSERSSSDIETTAKKIIHITEAFGNDDDDLHLKSIKESQDTKTATTTTASSISSDKLSNIGTIITMISSAKEVSNTNNSANVFNQHDLLPLIEDVNKFNNMGSEFVANVTVVKNAIQTYFNFLLNGTYKCFENYTQSESNEYNEICKINHTINANEVKIFFERELLNCDLEIRDKIAMFSIYFQFYGKIMSNELKVSSNFENYMNLKHKINDLLDRTNEYSIEIEESFLNCYKTIVRKAQAQVKTVNRRYDKCLFEFGKRIRKNEENSNRNFGVEKQNKIDELKDTIEKVRLKREDIIIRTENNNNQNIKIWNNEIGLLVNEVNKYFGKYVNGSSNCAGRIKDDLLDFHTSIERRNKECLERASKIIEELFKRTEKLLKALIYELKQVEKGDLSVKGTDYLEAIIEEAQAYSNENQISYRNCHEKLMTRGRMRFHKLSEKYLTC